MTLRIQRAILTAISFALMLVLAGATSAVAGQEPAAPPDAMSVQGQLIEVNDEEKTLVVATAAETPMQFKYTDDTEVTGAQESIEGLSGASDRRVTVEYRQEGDERVATKIQVHPEEQ